MPIEMPRGLPFSVDTWTPSSAKKRHHFLTHAHKDHSHGISSYSSYPIYCTRLTRSLLLQHYPQLDESLFVGIEVGQSLNIDDPDGTFTVTTFDANHCPGAVMFLFEGNFGSILHTGDCRLTPECLQNLPEKYVGKKGKEPGCRLDYIFLDCTFGKSPVINCIWNHPGANLVYLTCDLLGQEEVLVNVSQTFGTQIFVDKDRYSECFQTLRLTAPQVLSQHSSSRFQVLDGFPKLYERAETIIAEAQANLHPEPLIIRPSAQWYACEEGVSESGKARKVRCSEAVRDQFGVWHVCYSTHSSRIELEWALQLLLPNRVVSTTQGCWAMELDYVKRCCFKPRPGSDDALWKLLDITVETSSTSDATTEASACSTVIQRTTESHVELHMQSNEVSISQKVLNMLPPKKAQPVTLFGRARLGLHDSICSYRGNERSSSNIGLANELFRSEEDILLRPEHNKVECGASSITEDQSKKVECAESSNTDDRRNIDSRTRELKEEKVDAWKELEVETRYGKQDAKKVDNPRDDVFSSIGSRNKYSGSVRKLYRSMNVPVPQPLPSLMQLMEASKHKRRFRR